jgi:hypothetical protein
MRKIVLANNGAIILANGRAIMTCVPNILAMVMGKPHDGLFGRVFIYRRSHGVS